jgi:hypothetical protein
LSSPLFPCIVLFQSLPPEASNDSCGCRFHRFALRSTTSLFWFFLFFSRNLGFLKIFDSLLDPILDVSLLFYDA